MSCPLSNLHDGLWTFVLSLYWSDCLFVFLALLTENKQQITLNFLTNLDLNFIFLLKVPFNLLLFTLIGYDREDKKGAI